MLKDTLRAQDRLKEGGFDEEHARAIIDVWAMTSDQIATKQDIADLRTEIRQAQLETTQNTRNWVAGGVGLIAVLMTIYEFIG